MVCLVVVLDAKMAEIKKIRIVFRNILFLPGNISRHISFACSFNLCLVSKPNPRWDKCAAFIRLC